MKKIKHKALETPGSVRTRRPGYGRESLMRFSFSMEESVNENAEKKDIEEREEKNVRTILDEPVTKLRFLGGAIDGWANFGESRDARLACYYILDEIADALDTVNDRIAPRGES